MTQPKKKFKIGQVVYILSTEGKNIIPGLVIEEQTIQTLEGTTVSWKLAVGPSEKQKIVESSKMNGEIYTDLEEIRNHLRQNFNQYVTNVIDLAKKRESSWYAKYKVATTPQKQSVDNLMDGLEDNEISVNEIHKTATVGEAREHLKNSIIPSREELQSDLEEVGDMELELPGTNKVVITGPNGKPMVANLKPTII